MNSKYSRFRSLIEEYKNEQKLEYSVQESIIHMVLNNFDTFSYYINKSIDEWIAYDLSRSINVIESKKDEIIKEYLSEQLDWFIYK